MHITIINGSPRTKQFSNTDKIIQAFTQGFSDANGDTYDVYSISDRREWDAAHRAFLTSDDIIIALPLYVECVPSLLLEFLETLPTQRERPAMLSFILHGGYAEACQLKCGKQFLISLPAQLGCNYGGCLVRGNSFGIRIFKGKERNKILKPYIAMGSSFALHGNFLTQETIEFAGPDVFPWLLRKFIMMSFRLFGKRIFNRAAAEWGCTHPLDDQPY